MAAPVAWDELQNIERSDAFTIADAEVLIGRAGQSGLDEWDIANQRLPLRA